MKFLYILSFLWLINPTEQLNILLVIPGVTNSLRMFNYRLAGALQLHGHNVTALLISFHSLDDHVSPPSGVELIEFQGIAEKNRTEDDNEAITDFVYKSPSLSASRRLTRQFNEMHYEVCQNLLSSEIIDKLLSSRKFDLALSYIYAICPVAVLRERQIPAGFACAGMYIFDSFAMLMGIPFPTSYVPSVLTFNSDLMSFWERIVNMFYQELVVGFLESGQDTFAYEDEIIRRPPNDDLPNALDTVANVPVLFLNGEQLLDFPRPMTLNVQYTGNLERRVRKSLSPTLKILQVAPAWIGSLRLFNSRLATALALHNHNVTVLEVHFETAPKNFTYAPGVNVISFMGVRGAVSEEINNAFNDMVFKGPSISTLMHLHVAITELHLDACKILNDDLQLLDKLNAEKYDFALSHIYAICPLAMLKDMNVPTGFLCAGTYVMDAVAMVLGIPFTPSFIPNSVLPYTDTMNFKEKLLNFFLGAISVVTFRGDMHIFTAEANWLQNPPYTDRESVVSTASDIPMILLNGDPLLDFPRPTTINVRYTGNLDRKTKKSLSLEWVKLVEDSPNGFILFSLGTVANTTAMPEEWKAAFLHGLGRFPDIRVFWRFEGELPGVENYPNIKTVSWLPQPELLAHPKCRLFLTHGGYNSFLETAQSGKPVVMIPLFFDQLGNARRAERFGLGLYLDKLTLTADRVADAIQKILTDKTYERNAMKLSSMLSDKIRPNEDLTIEHIERIARHYNSYPRLSRSIRKLSAVQFYSLDVLTFFTLVLVVIFSALIHILKIGWRFVDAQAHVKMMKKTKKQTKLD